VAVSFYSVSIAPTLEMNTLEFPDKHILPIGFNVTIICTSNASKETYGSPYHGQPYWVQQEGILLEHACDRCTKSV